MTEHRSDLTSQFARCNPVAITRLIVNDAIKKSYYNLNTPRYVDKFEEEEEIDLMAVRKERLALQKELDELEVEMAGYLEELGYGA